MKKGRKVLTDLFLGKNIKFTLAVILAVIGVIILLLIANAVNLRYAKTETEKANSTDTTEITLSYAYQNAEWNGQIERIIDDFEKANPDITINYEPDYEHQVYENLLMKKAAMGQSGDVIQLKTPKEYAKSGILAEIPESVTSLSTYNYELKGKVYAVGAVRGTSGILYNKEIFRKLGLSEPETYAQFQQICRRLSDAGITPVGVAGGDLWHMEYWVNHFFRTDIVAKDKNWLKKCRRGKVKWTDEESLAMLRHLYSMFHAGYINANWLSTRDADLAYLMTQVNLGMLYTGPWTAVGISSRRKSMDLGWFYLPDESGKTYVAENKDVFWGISRECAQNSRKYKAAIRFLQYFYSRDSYTKLLEETSLFPAVPYDIRLKRTDLQKSITDGFRNADKEISTYIGDASCPQDFEEKMLQEVEEMLSGQVSISDAAAAIQTYWEDGLKQEAVK